MRAVAVLLVVVAHAGLGHVVPGGSGVTMFFSISGFIIAHLLLRERERSGGFDVGSFYMRRLLKLAPPLVAVVVLPTLIYAAFRPVNWSDFAAQIFFAYNWVSLDHTPEVLPGSGVVWSLAIEEQFYIGFSVLWLCAVRASRRPELTLGVVSLLVVAYSTAARFALVGDSDRIYFATDTRIDGMALGILAALALRASRSRPEGREAQLVRAAGRDSVLIGAGLLYLLSLVIREPAFRDTLRFTMQSVASCAVILWGFADRDSRLRRAVIGLLASAPVQMVGLASYSIYLVHLPLIYLIDDTWAPSGFLDLAVSIAVGIGAGVALYILLERPVARWWAARQRSA